MADTRVYVVNVKGGAEYTSINDAIKAAVDGDTIQVHLGQYEEVLLLDRAVHIVPEPGIEVADVVVTGGAVCTANGSITGIAIQQLVDVRAGSPTLKNCDVSLGSDGVRVCTGAEALIENCRIFGSQSGGDGVYVQEGAKVKVVGSELYHHRVNGVHVNGGEAQIIGCKIHDCPFGVYFRKSGKGVVEGNTFDTLSRFGVYIVTSSDPLVAKNVIMNCGISGIMIAQGALGQIRDNTVHATVRILRGCAPTLGVNTINGHFDNENNAPPPGATAVSLVDTQPRPSMSR